MQSVWYFPTHLKPTFETDFFTHFAQYFWAYALFFCFVLKRRRHFAKIEMMIHLTLIWSWELGIHFTASKQKFLFSHGQVSVYQKTFYGSMAFRLPYTKCVGWSSVRFSDFVQSHDPKIRFFLSHTEQSARAARRCAEVSSALPQRLYWGEFAKPMQCMCRSSVMCSVKMPVNVLGMGPLIQSALRSLSYIVIGWIPRVLECLMQVNIYFIYTFQSNRCLQRAEFWRKLRCNPIGALKRADSDRVNGCWLASLTNPSGTLMELWFHWSPSSPAPIST